jgi:hypothetical protein
MRVHSSTRFAAIAVLVGALACAGNKAETDADEAAAARDTTATDTLGGDVQNQPGYRGMERDTTLAPQAEQQPSDTFLQNQGVGGAQDTSGFSGAERVDTTGQANPAGAAPDTTARDTTSMTPTDTTSMTPTDTSLTKPADTTGYNPSQQPADTTR